MDGMKVGELSNVLDNAISNMAVGDAFLILVGAVLIFLILFVKGMRGA